MQFALGQSFAMDPNDWGPGIAYLPSPVALAWAECAGPDALRIARNIEELASRKQQTPERDSVVVEVTPLSQTGQPVTLYIALRYDGAISKWVLYQRKIDLREPAE